MIRHRFYAWCTFGLILAVSQLAFTPPWRAPTNANAAVITTAAVHPAWSPPAEVASVALPAHVAARAIKPVPAKPKPVQKVKRAPPNTQVIYPFGIR